MKIESLVFGNVVTNARQQKQINKPAQKRSRLIKILIKYASNQRTILYEQE